MAFFKPNPNLERELMAEGELSQGLAGAAQPAAVAARSFANRIMPSGREPHIQVVQEGSKVLLANFDHGGHLDEWGSINNPPNASLRRGVRAAGLRLKEN